VAICNIVAGIYLDDRGHVERLRLRLYDDAGRLNYIGRCRSSMSTQCLILHVPP